METVEDDEGRRYVRLKRSTGSSLVHNPEREEVTHVPNDRLEPVEGEPPLRTAATAVSEPVRAVLTAVHSERGLGLLIVLDERDDLDAHALLAQTSFCESDLFATLREFAAAELIERSTADRWVLTDRGRAAVTALRQS